MFTLRSLHVPTKPLTVTSVPFVSESHGLCSGRGGGRSAAAAAAALSKRASVASARATSRSASSCGTRALSVRYSEIIARSDTGSLNMASWSLSASSDAQSIGCCCCCSPVPPEAGGMAPGGAGRRADAMAACPLPRYHPGPTMDAPGRSAGPPAVGSRLSTPPSGRRAKRVITASARTSVRASQKAPRQQPPHHHGGHVRAAAQREQAAARPAR